MRPSFARVPPSSCNTLDSTPARRPTRSSRRSVPHPRRVMKASDNTLPRIYSGIQVWEVEDDHPGQALERDLAASIEGEVRFDRASRAAYHGCLQLPSGPHGRRHTKDHLRRGRGGPRVPASLRGDHITRWRDEPRRPGRQRRRRHRLLQVPQPRAFDRRSIPNRDGRPGCVLDDLRVAVSQHGLTFGPDPASHDRNTIGGMIGNNSCGVHSVMSDLIGPGPLTADQVIELETLTYDGHRMTVGATSPADLEPPRQPGGPDRSDLWGSEAPGRRARRRDSSGFPRHSQAGLRLQPPSPAA